MSRGVAVRTAVLALTLVAVQTSAIRLAPSAVAVRIVLPATIAAVPAVLWPLRRRLGIWIMFVGLAANLAAIVANGGLMPIEQRSVIAAVGAESAAGYVPGAWISASKDVLVTGHTGRAVALGDSVVIHIGEGGLVASPGDLVVWAGLVVLALESSLAWQHRSASTRRADDAAAQNRAAEGGALTSS